MNDSSSHLPWWRDRARVVRGFPGSQQAELAVSEAGAQLRDLDGLSAFKLALDVVSDRCHEAIAGVWFGRESEGEPWIVQLIQGREELAGLGALVGRAALASDGDDESLVAAERLAVEVAAAVDAASDERQVIELALRAPAPVDASELRPLAEIAALHCDDWWWAVLARARHARRLAEAAASLADDVRGLIAWLPALRRAEVSRGWVDERVVEEVNQELAHWIDCSYQPQVSRSRNDDLIFKALWHDFVSPILNEGLAPRAVPATARRLLARAVTLALTLLDRVQGRAAAGRRTPRSIERLGWAAHAWRLADPTCPDAAAVYDAFQRRYLTRKKRKAAHPHAIAIGCTAVAAFLARIGYPDEAGPWLKRARSAGGDRARTLAAIAGAWVQIARGFLRDPADPVASRDAADAALACAAEARDLAARDGEQVDEHLDGRAFGARALARAAAGDAAGADADLGAALAALATVDPRDRSRYAHMDQCRELLLRRGDVDGAAAIMQSYVEWCCASAHHVRHQAERTRLHASAAAVQCSIATLLIDHDRTAEGTTLLLALARDRSAPQRWREEADALLRARDVESSLADARPRDPRRWARLEEEAQRKYRYARACLPADRAQAIEQAVVATEIMLRERPSDRIVRTRAAHLAISKHDAASLAYAKQLLDRLEDEVPDDSYVIFAQGRLALAASEHERAVALLRRAYDLHPRVETLTLLATALLRSGRADDVVRMAAQHGHDAPLVDLGGLALLATGDLAGAWTHMVRAATLLAEDGDEPRANSPRPRRMVALVRRLAALSERVEVGLVLDFLRRGDPLLTVPLVAACTADLRFEPSLRMAILDSGARVPALRRAVAQYAMGVAIHEDTRDGPVGVARWLQQVWDQLDLAGRPGLIAETLAGAKGVYARALRSALDGDPRQHGAMAGRWLSANQGTSALATHVATPGYVADYYATAERLVAARTWTARDFIDEAVSVIGRVRRAVIDDRGLRQHLNVLADTTAPRAGSWLLPLANIEGAPALDTARGLGLVAPDDPLARTVVFAPHAAIAWAVAHLGPPASVQPAEDQTALVASWATEWPAEARAVCEADGLWLGHGSLAIPVVSYAAA